MVAAHLVRAQVGAVVKAQDQVLPRARTVLDPDLLDASTVRHKGQAHRVVRGPDAQLIVRVDWRESVCALCSRYRVGRVDALSIDLPIESAGVRAYRTVVYEPRRRRGRGGRCVGRVLAHSAEELLGAVQ